MLANSNGCLLEGSAESEKLDVGKYAVGWIKTGPKGVLDLTFYSSGETLVNLRNHLNFNMLAEKADPRGSLRAPCIYFQDGVKALLKNHEYLTYDQWAKVNKYEI